VMLNAEELGCEITHDWTSYELAYTDRHERSRKCALADIEGVVTADIVVALLTDDDYAYRGTSSEIGAALAASRITGSKKPLIWVVASKDPRETPEAELPRCLTSCFMHTADAYFRSIGGVMLSLGIHVAHRALVLGLRTKR
jgi:nucleoside 2-deoxyribosyltransferase